MHSVLNEVVVDNLKISDDLKRAIHIASIAKVLEADRCSHLFTRSRGRFFLEVLLLQLLPDHVRGELIRAITELCVDELALPQTKLL